MPYDVRPLSNTVSYTPRTREHFLLSRTSSIMEAIRDDNDLTREETQNTVEHTPFYINDDKIHSHCTTVLHGETPKEKEMTATGTLDSSNDIQISSRDDNGEFNLQDIIDRPPDGTFWGWTAAACVCMINCFSWGC